MVPTEFVPTKSISEEPFVYSVFDRILVKY